MKTESRMVPDGMSSNATRSQEGKVTKARSLWHDPVAMLGNKNTTSLGEA
jgi:hypothetical protein